jgi:hypothetical protein
MPGEVDTGGGYGPGIVQAEDGPCGKWCEYSMMGGMIKRRTLAVALIFGPLFIGFVVTIIIEPIIGLILMGLLIVIGCPAAYIVKKKRREEAEAKAEKDRRDREAAAAQRRKEKEERDEAGRKFLAEKQEKARLAALEKANAEAEPEAEPEARP